MAVKKTQGKKARERTQAQIESELRREIDGHGKTLVRHTAESAAALKKLRSVKPYDTMSDPEIMRVTMMRAAPKRAR
jgi:uncharacterized membrane-anchored protein YhcB (DUF1043 family)